MNIAHPEETKNIYKINQVARMTGLSQKRIRDYEKEGLIKPLRDSNTNDRLFSGFEVKQIRKIKDLIHKRGFTIAALKQLLVTAHGFNVFKCQEKENCEAFKNPHKPCWEVLKEFENSHYREFCKICPIFLLRRTDKRKILEKPGDV